MPAAKAAAPTGAPGATGGATAPQRPRAAADPQEAPTGLDLDPGWRFASALGIQSGLGDADFDGVGFRLDVEHEVTRLSPETTLSFVGALSLTHASGTKDVSIVVDPFAGRTVVGRIEWDANVIELLPTARLTYRATPAISLIADGGVGVGYTTARARPSISLAATAPADPVDGGAGGVVRLAGGLVITASPALRIAVEALGLRLRFGNGPGSAFELGLSISHRL
jgi:hypothetical protein